MNAALSDPKCNMPGKGQAPCYSQVVNNQYCKIGKFIDASQSSTDSWNAIVKNNTEHCREL